MTRSYLPHPLSTSPFTHRSNPERPSSPTASPVSILYLLPTTTTTKTTDFMTMASAIKSALPSHLKPSAADGEAGGRHHGKTRSHMVSSLQLQPGLVDSFPWIFVSTCHACHASYSTPLPSLTRAPLPRGERTVWRSRHHGPTQLLCFPGQHGEAIASCSQPVTIHSSLPQFALQFEQQSAPSHAPFLRFFLWSSSCPNPFIYLAIPRPALSQTHPPPQLATLPIHQSTIVVLF